MFPTCKARSHGKSGDRTARFLAALQGTSLSHLHTVSHPVHVPGGQRPAPLFAGKTTVVTRGPVPWVPHPLPSFPRHKPADRPSGSATSLGGWGRRTVKSLPARGVRRPAPAGNGLLMSFFQDNNETPVV